jgi:hypothetical protein
MSGKKYGGRKRPIAQLANLAPPDEMLDFGFTSIGEDADDDCCCPHVDIRQSQGQNGYAILTR